MVTNQNQSISKFNTACSNLMCLTDDGWSARNHMITRMRSSRMHTVRSSRGCLSVCWDTPHRPGPGHPRSLVWAWRPPGCGPGDPPPSQTPTSPLGVGLETPQPDPPTSPRVWAWRPSTSQTPQLLPWVWDWRPPDPTTSPPGVGLETSPPCEQNS